MSNEVTSSSASQGAGDMPVEPSETPVTTGKSGSRVQAVVLAFLGIGFVGMIGLLALWYYSSRMQEDDSTEDRIEESADDTADSERSDTPDESDADETDDAESEISYDGWKTYTDTVYNYTIKYPPSWTVEPTPSGGGVAILTGKHDGDDMNVQISKHDEKILEDESLAIFEERRTTDIFGNEAYEGVEPVDESYVTVANMKTYRQITEVTGEDGYSIYYVFAKDSDAYFFNWYTLDYEEHMDYAEAILDTFEFASK